MHRGRLQRGIEPSESGKDRRGTIRYALFQCIRDKGYAATTLADVAAAAGLSASHLLYYYDSKDAVLEDLFTVATRHMLDDIAKLPWDRLDAAIEAIADYFFGGKFLSRTEIATMLQFWGLSTHHPRLRETKTAFDDDLRRRLIELFQRGKREGVSARDAADIAYALLSGLLSAVYFSPDLDLARARSLVRSTFGRLAGIRPRKE